MFPPVSRAPCCVAVARAFLSQIAHPSGAVVCRKQRVDELGVFAERVNAREGKAVSAHLHREIAVFGFECMAEPGNAFYAPLCECFSCSVAATLLGGE
jgi:hypothetical protein